MHPAAFSDSFISSHVVEGKLQERSSDSIVLPAIILMGIEIEQLIAAVFLDLQNNIVRTYGCHSQ